MTNYPATLAIADAVIFAIGAFAVRNIRGGALAYVLACAAGGFFIWSAVLWAQQS
jgi:hypothetical protein